MCLEPSGLIVSGVDKSFAGAAVLKGIDVHVQPHEFVAILGHSGCGKSTLLNLVAGFLQPDAGHIAVNGLPVKGPSKARGVVFQEHALFPWYTVLQNIMFGPDVQGMPKRQAREHALHYLDLVGLKDYAQHLPSNLSGGMKQRVGIARALASGPDVLLMDEPFGALDILTRDMMQRELLRIWLELRIMVLFITHSISEAIHLADKVLVMVEGQIAAEFAITMPRPRNYANSDFIELQTQIEHVLIADRRSA